MLFIWNCNYNIVRASVNIQDIVPDIIEYIQESIKRIFNFGLFWAVNNLSGLNDLESLISSIKLLSWIIPSTQMIKTSPFLWNGSSKSQFFTDIWYPFCWRLLRPVDVTFLKTGCWNSNVQTSWSQ